MTTTGITHLMTVFEPMPFAKYSCFVTPTFAVLIVLLVVVVAEEVVALIVVVVLTVSASITFTEGNKTGHWKTHYKTFI